MDDAAAAKAAAANPAAPNVPADGIAEAKLEALSLTSTPDAPPPVGYQTGAAEHEGPANWQDAPQDDNGAADFATGGAEAVPIVGEVEDAVRKGEDGEAARGSAFHEASSS